MALLASILGVTHSVKIATFNINGIRRRFEVLRRWLNQEKPDVFCLQELKCEQEVFPAGELLDLGYQSVWMGQRSWNGVAICSRIGEPIVTRTFLPGDGSDGQSRYIEAAVQGYIFGCIYAPNGNPKPGPKFDYKIAWLNRLVLHARSLKKSELPVILAGDFNVAPRDIDIYPTRSWDDDALIDPKARKILQTLVGRSWLDCLRHRYPKERIYTFWDYRRQRFQRNAGLRIDHLLLSPSLLPRLDDAGVDSWVRGLPGASDHAPVWAKIGT